MSAHGIVDNALRDKIIMRHRAERVKRLIPHDVVEKMLERVKADYPLAIVTNGSPAVQRFKLDKSGRAAHFFRLLCLRRCRRWQAESETVHIRVEIAQCQSGRIRDDRQLVEF